MISMLLLSFYTNMLLYLYLIVNQGIEQGNMVIDVIDEYKLIGFAKIDRK